MFQKPRRPHKDPLCTKHSAGYSHRELYCIGCVSGFIWEIIAPETFFSPSHSTEHGFMSHERGIPLALKKDQPSDKMEHNISNIAWIDQKAECKGKELLPATLHCWGGGLVVESRGGFRLYFTRHSECNWLAERYCWLWLTV